MIKLALFPDRLLRAPHGRSWFHYAVGMFLHALFFALLGPACGALVASIGFGGLVWAPIALAFAYVGYVWAAALAGACVAVATSVFTSPWKLYGVAALIGGLCAMGYGPFLPPRPETPLFSSANSPLIGVIGAVSSVICTRLIGSLRLQSSNPFFAKPHTPDRGSA